MQKKVMVRAHELAKMMEGDYAARMSLALKQAWQEAKEVKLDDICETVKEEGNRNWDAREWANYGKTRVYLNFKGKGQGFLEVVEGKIQKVNVRQHWMESALASFVGKDYRFGA